MAEALNKQDLEQLAALGIRRQDALRQLELFSSPPAPARLDRPCRVGDGIRRLAAGDHADLTAACDAATEAGRLSKLVPASGAASRMFRPLLALLGDEATSADQADGQQFLSQAHRFPFATQLDRLLHSRGQDLKQLQQAGELRQLLQAALAPEAAGEGAQHGLGLADRPKALIPFHAYGEQSRTAFDEQLVEAAHHLCDREGQATVHFTVAPRHEPLFHQHLAQAQPRLEQEQNRRFQISFSHQSRATDTLAGDPRGGPARRRDGSLVLRPGGHGALLGNLEALGGDIVLIKNIDNVVPDHRRSPVLLWKRLLVGLLVRLQERIHQVLRRAESGQGGAWIEEGLAFASDELGMAQAAEQRGKNAEDQRAFLLEALHRPLRVCGVVPNQGEPGGGPFWVQGPGGATSPQIVEVSQVDLQDPSQSSAVQQATHFNPVDLVCGLRDHHGRAYDLQRFVDPAAVFISRKSEGGRELLALERPGLWNGAMAHWLTVFVEVPAETFAPVKTVFDLLRPAHQPE